jgi:hypothetical protein
MEAGVDRKVQSTVGGFAGRGCVVINSQAALDGRAKPDHGVEEGVGAILVGRRAVLPVEVGHPWKVSQKASKKMYRIYPRFWRLIYTRWVLCNFKLSAQKLFYFQCVA